MKRLAFYEGNYCCIIVSLYNAGIHESYCDSIKLHIYFESVVDNEKKFWKSFDKYFV